MPSRCARQVGGCNPSDLHGCEASHTELRPPKPNGGQAGGRTPAEAEAAKGGRPEVPADAPEHSRP